tara:strand:+ start:59 stop:322 length:264 start_codon:yes stop_codon:yes gene_type:complete
MLIAHKFKVLELLSLKNSVVVIAKQTHVVDFEITLNSHLNGVAISSLQQPRKLDNNGHQLSNYWAFTLKNKSDIVKFNIGDLVDLHT